MYQKLVAVIIFIIGIVSQAGAQESLPNFSLEDLGQNKMRVSWSNPYGSCVQLNVQRSYDSLKNFRTIYSALSPELPQNGIVDKAPTNQVYYRIFYVLPGGVYYFTKAKTVAQGFSDISMPGDGDMNKMITVRGPDSVLASLSMAAFLRFKDSVVYRTRDSLFMINSDEVLLKPYVPQLAAIWTPSVNLFTSREGNVILHLPDAKQKKYKVVVFDSDGKTLFTINHVKDTELILDKADFVHAGWFTFDLYENDRIKEKNKFYIPKEF
ncbi:MAG: hypothetical protein J0I41_02175 [Filimonas sp.]|nr:hypothetical protein [Filimonas sp.]